MNKVEVVSHEVGIETQFSIVTVGSRSRSLLRLRKLFDLTATGAFEAVDKVPAGICCRLRCICKFATLGHTLYRAPRLNLQIKRTLDLLIHVVVHDEAIIFKFLL